MTLGLWLSFIVASILIIAMPGPVVTLLITTSISRGKSAAFRMIPGTFLGDLTSMLLSFAGVGALLVTSPTLFISLKMLGACYLLYLGIQMWVESGGFHGAQGKQAVKGRSVLKAFWVTVSNPKSFLFFVAFMPQFINKKEFFLPQLLILGGTYLSLGLLNDMTYTILADKAGLFLNRYSPQKIIYRIGALNMIVTGILVFARIAK